MQLAGTGTTLGAWPDAPPTYEDADVRIDKLVVGPFENNVFVVRCKATRRGRAPRRRQRARAAARGEPGHRRPAGAHHPRPLGPHPGGRGRPRRRHRRRHRGRGRLDAARLRLHDPRRRRRRGRRLRLRTIHTPGHTPGSTCFLLEGKPVLFSGDTLFPGGAGQHQPRGRRLRADHRVDRPAPVHAAGRHCSCSPATASTPPSATSAPHLQEWVDRGW